MLSITVKQEGILYFRIIVSQYFYLSNEALAQEDFVNQLRNQCAATLATLRSTLNLLGTFTEAKI